MEKKLTAELKALKEEFDFIHKKIGDLEWNVQLDSMERKLF